MRCLVVLGPTPRLPTPVVFGSTPKPVVLGSTPEPVVLGSTTRPVVLGPTPESVVLGPTPTHLLLPTRPPCTRVGNDRVSRTRPNILRQHPGFLQEQLGSVKGFLGGRGWGGAWAFKVGILGGGREPRPEFFFRQLLRILLIHIPPKLARVQTMLPIEPSLFLGVLGGAMHISTIPHQLPELVLATS